MKRVTLQRPIEVKGLGLHKGKETKVLMLPSEEESGIMIGTSKRGGGILSENASFFLRDVLHVFCFPMVR